MELLNRHAPSAEALFSRINQELSEADRLSEALTDLELRPSQAEQADSDDAGQESQEQQLIGWDRRSREGETINLMSQHVECVFGCSGALCG